MPDLRQQQSAFAAHLRDPAANPPPPGIEPRRMAIYRDLFFNNIAGLLAANFPVIRRTLGEDAWRALVRRFYSTHRSRTPLFPERIAYTVPYKLSDPEARLYKEVTDYVREGEEAEIEPHWVSLDDAVSAALTGQFRNGTLVLGALATAEFLRRERAV